jgi:sigma-B regulation protein RsbU (phosphoserine phosphatase)
VPSGRSPSEETLAVLDHAACGLMQTSEDGTFRRVNAVFCRWIGHDCAALIGRRRLQDLLTMGGRIFHQTHWLPLLQMQGSLSEVKLELVHVNGTSIPMVLNAIRHEVDGECVHEIAAFVAHDRDRYEQELVLSRKRLEVLVAEAKELHEIARDRALFAEQMIGIVSHDLRNPLSTIQMATELLASSDGGDVGRLTGQIQRAVDRATRLLADLLDFTQARVGSGLAVSPSPANLHDAVSEILDGLRVAYPGRRLIHRSSGKGLCDVDVNRLAQVIGNLVSNAAAYGTPGTAIEVSSTVEDTSYSIAVTNDGDPIPPEVLSTLFQPMTRGTRESNQQRSVGLGLFIVHEIAKAHGGTASVRSSATGGTTFTVLVPRTPRP